VRPFDVATFVAFGAAHIGICGADSEYLKAAGTRLPLLNDPVGYETVRATVAAPFVLPAAGLVTWRGPAGLG